MLHAMSVSSIVEVLSGSIVVFYGLTVSPMGQVAVLFPNEAGNDLHLSTLGRLVVIIKTDKSERC